jgi:hypothetical protein
MDFGGVWFPEKVNWFGLEFPCEADFAGATFAKGANFSEARFSDVTFREANFLGEASRIVAIYLLKNAVC